MKLNDPYKVAFFVLLAGIVAYLGFHQFYADRNQFERLFYLEQNQVRIIQWINQHSPQGK